VPQQGQHACPAGPTASAGPTRKPWLGCPARPHGLRQARPPGRPLSGPACRTRTHAPAPQARAIPRHRHAQSRATGTRNPTPQARAIPRPRANESAHPAHGGRPRARAPTGGRTRAAARRLRGHAGEGRGRRRLRGHAGEGRGRRRLRKHACALTRHATSPVTRRTRHAPRHRAAPRAPHSPRVEASVYDHAVAG
jgi:hypothetical protein